MSPPLEEWARAYLATLAIEVPIVAGWLRDRAPPVEVAAVALLASTLTHPALWYAWPRFEPGWAWLGGGEALVWTAEALVYWIWLRRAGVPGAGRRALAVACLANGSSMAAGLLLLQG
jgi:hypothetical protein